VEGVEEQKERENWRNGIVELDNEVKKAGRRRT